MLPAQIAVEDETYSTFQVLCPLAANYFSSVSVVLVNKYVTKQWPFGYTLTCIHFITTFLLLGFFCWIGVFKYKRLSVPRVAVLSLMFTLSIVFNNKSIQHNTVGFFQTMKISITPTVAIIEVFFLKYRIPLRLYIPIGLIILGVSLSTIKDFGVNFVGCVYGIGGVLTTALYQILSRTKQQELNCSSLQLLLFETPLAAIMLIFVVPFVENYNFTDESSVWNRAYNASLVLSIAYTALGAAVINISIFLAIRRSSALTYNVISQLKGITILTLGTILFHEHLSLRQICGMLMAILGIFDYSRVKLIMRTR